MEKRLNFEIKKESLSDKNNKFFVFFKADNCSELNIKVI